MGATDLKHSKNILVLLFVVKNEKIHKLLHHIAGMIHQLFIEVLSYGYIKWYF